MINRSNWRSLSLLLFVSLMLACPRRSTLLPDDGGPADTTSPPLDSGPEAAVDVSTDIAAPDLPRPKCKPGEQMTHIKVSRTFLLPVGRSRI